MTVAIMSRHQFREKLFQTYLNTQGHKQILPSLIIAQGMLESAHGTSRLAIEANNLFGVKGQGDAGSIKIQTKEWSKTRGWYTIMADFKKYSSWEKALEDQIRRFTTMPRYAKVKNEMDYKKAVQYVFEGGYATDPAYVQKVIDVIERNKLYEYDEIVFKPQLPTWAEQPTKNAINNLASKGMLAKDSIDTHLNQTEWTLPVPKYLFWILIWRIVEFYERRKNNENKRR